MDIILDHIAPEPYFVLILLCHLSEIIYFLKEIFFHILSYPSVLNFNCCCNKLPQIQWLKNTTNLLSYSFGCQKSQMDLIV